MANYSIKDLEKMSGIKAHTIRIWEKRYCLISPLRTDTNIRFYNDVDLKKILNTAILLKNGYKISKIAHLSGNEMSDKVLLHTQKHNDSSNAIESLILSMIEFDEVSFDKVLSNLIIKMGFEDTFTKVLYPFFERIGVLWQAGSIMPAQEHFISNLVRQKLIVALDGQRATNKNNSVRFLLFLPEGELHEIGLLFFNLILKKRGFQTLYLGQTVPISDIKSIIENTRFDYFITSINTPMPTKKFNETIRFIGEQFASINVFISGAQTQAISGNIPANIYVIKSPEEFIERLNIIS